MSNIQTKPKNLESLGELAWSTVCTLSATKTNPNITLVPLKSQKFLPQQNFQRWNRRKNEILWRKPTNANTCEILKQLIGTSKSVEIVQGLSQYSSLRARLYSRATQLVASLAEA